MLALNRTLHAEISTELYFMRTFHLTVTASGPHIIVDDLGLKQPFLNNPVYDHLRWDKLRCLKIDILHTHDSVERTDGVIHYHCFEYIVERIKNVSRLPRIEIGMSKELLEKFSAMKLRDTKSRDITDSTTNNGIATLDAILSPLRLLTNVEQLTIHGVEYGNLKNIRTDWISDFPRPLESLVMLPRGGLDPKEQTSLDNHAQAAEVLMHSFLNSSFHPRLRWVRELRGLDPSYVRMMAEKVDTCDYLTLRQKRFAFCCLRCRDEDSFEEFVKSKHFVGPVRRHLYKPRWPRGIHWDRILHRERAPLEGLVHPPHRFRRKMEEKRTEGKCTLAIKRGLSRLSLLPLSMAKTG